MTMKTKRRKNGKKSRIDRLVVLLFLVVFLGASSCCVLKQIGEYQSLKKEETRLAEEIKTAKKETLTYESNKNYYNSDAYIEQVAREKLGLIKPTEILFLERVENN